MYIKLMLFLGDCGIGTEGFNKLSHGNWPNLKMLWVGTLLCKLEKNGIKYDGCAGIAVGNWRKLRACKLCLF